MRQLTEYAPAPVVLKTEEKITADAVVSAKLDIFYDTWWITLLKSIGCGICIYGSVEGYKKTKSFILKRRLAHCGIRLRSLGADSIRAFIYDSHQDVECRDIAHDFWLD